MNFEFLGPKFVVPHLTRKVSEMPDIGKRIPREGYDAQRSESAKIQYCKRFDEMCFFSTICVFLNLQTHFYGLLCF